MHAFAQANDNVRQVERTPPKNEAEKAIACYGAVCPQSHHRWLFFSDGQPNSDKTILFLQALLQIAKDKRFVVIIWDQATWHTSNITKTWLRQHNHQVRKNGGVRLLTFLLPSKSPWLNSMEPIWLHSKRKVSEPEGELSADILKDRLCSLFNTSLDDATLKASA